jgi:hypothetical protein
VKYRKALRSGGLKRADFVVDIMRRRDIRSGRAGVLMGVLKVRCAETEIRYQPGARKPGAKIAET